MMGILVILGCMIGFFAGAAVAVSAQALLRGNLRQRRQASKEQARLRVILRNVEVYDGTGTGQKELPRN